jgi:ethanolamine utilization protein EutQ (cupin superfamily)
MTRTNAQPIIVDSARAERYQVGPNRDEGTITRLIGRTEGSSVLFGLFQLDPGQKGEFGLPHPSGMEQEIYYLLAGQLEVTCDGTRVVAEAGQAVFFPGGATYQIETLGTEPVRLAWTGFPPP